MICREWCIKQRLDLVTPNPPAQLVSIELIALPYKQKSNMTSELIRREKKIGRPGFSWTKRFLHVHQWTMKPEILRWRRREFPPYRFCGPHCIERWSSSFLRRRARHPHKYVAVDSIYYGPIGRYLCCMKQFLAIVSCWYGIIDRTYGHWVGTALMIYEWTKLTWRLLLS